MHDLPTQLKLLVATTNAGKLREIQHELAARQMAVALLGLRDIPPVPEAVEDQPTFIGNAIKKALHYAHHSGLLTLADDSGLCVDALNGAPGVYSARYAGPHADDAANNAKLLQALAHVPPERRTGRFCCVMALAFPNNMVALVTDQVEGVLLHAPRGAGGFGYDPLFFMPELNCTTAELPIGKKSEISHRGKALRRMIPWIEMLPAAGACLPARGAEVAP